MEHVISLLREETTVREMTGNERKFLWIPAANVTVAARIRGELEEGRVRNAVERLALRHVLLRTRVVHRDGRAFFVSSDVPPVPVRFVRRGEETQWVEEVKTEYRTPFAPHTGPLIRVLVVCSETVSEVVLFSQHAICDGTGLVYVMRDLLTLLADPNLELEVLPLPPALSPENLPAGSDLPGFKAGLRNAAISRMNRNWRRSQAVFGQKDFEAIFKGYWDNNDYRILFLELGGQETERLVHACREHGVTVNSALCAAFLCAYGECGGSLRGSRQSVAVPVDLRQRMKPEAGDVLCLCVGSILFRYAYRRKVDFWENTKRIHALVSRDMEKANLFLPFHNLERLDHTLMEYFLSFAQMSAYVGPESDRYEALHAFGADRKNTAVKLVKKFTRALPGWR
jgi:NRPS condensation-like uncharacterized protein